MAGTLNTQASEFPEDPSILDTGTTNADEFRDIDLVSTAVSHKADFSSVPNESLSRPHDARAEAVAGRRAYANGPDLSLVSKVSESGTRRYASLSATAFPGTGGYAGAPTLLLGEDRSRVRIVLSNGHATDPVRIGKLDDVSNGGGMTLPPGVLFESQTTESIYCCVPVAGANAIAVGVWAEYA